MRFTSLIVIPIAYLTFAACGTGTANPVDCPPYSGPGCCIGDGLCCACAAVICSDIGGPITPNETAFSACICRPEVCGNDCVRGCAGNGLDCNDCAKTAAQKECQTEFVACNGGPWDAG